MRQTDDALSETRVFVINKTVKPYLEVIDDNTFHQEISVSTIVETCYNTLTKFIINYEESI